MYPGYVPWESSAVDYASLRQRAGNNRLHCTNVRPWTVSRVVTLSALNSKVILHLGSIADGYLFVSIFLLA